jgi:hypothetical protein
MAVRRPPCHQLVECGHAYRVGEVVRLKFDDDPEDMFLVSVKDLSHCLTTFAAYAPVVRVFSSMADIAGIARLSGTGQGVVIYLYYYRARMFVLRRQELAAVARGTLPETGIAEDVEYRPVVRSLQGAARC